MYRIQKKEFYESLFVTILFLASNIPAFLHMHWLNTDVVKAVTATSALIAIISLWVMRKEGLFGKFWLQLKQNWFLFPFVIYAFISIFWSIKWEISLYRWVLLVSFLFTGYILGLRFSPRKMATELSKFGILISLASVLLIIIPPSYGIMNYHSIQGAWKGIFWHKNHMGLVMVFLNILFLINLISTIKEGNKEKYVWGFMYAFSIFFIIKTDSVASYFSAIILHGLFLVWVLWKRFRVYLKRRHYIIFGVVLIVLAILLAMNLEFVFGLFNRNVTLTGRIPMWNYVFTTYFVKHPLIGYGFNAFWYELPYQIDIQQAAGYPDPIVIADNGFFDMLINTGIIGLALFLLFYFGVWYKAGQNIKDVKRSSDLLPILIMAFTLVSNISWSLVFENESFFMLLMVWILFLPGRNEVPSGNPI